jgi:hypothetical protein
MEHSRKLIVDLQKALKDIDLNSDKPVKDKLDLKVLIKLIEACKDFDMDSADEAMAELEEYRYESDNNLVVWLRECIDKMQFEDIVKKLSNLN